MSINAPRFAHTCGDLWFTRNIVLLMTKSEKAANLAAVVVPFVGVLLAIVLLWNSGSTPTTWILRRLLPSDRRRDHSRLSPPATHRSFQTHPWLERTFAVLGSLSVQGSVLDWVADHRKHHAHTDEEGDPHSPHVARHGSGLRGLWHAHVGWLTETQGQADWKKLRAGPLRGPEDARDRPRFPLLVLARPAPPPLAGLRAARARSRARSPGALGRAGSDLPRPSRDLVRQLRLPLLRQPALRRRRPVDQRLLARPPLARRVLAPQPPRLPALGRARAALVGARPLRR